jgi:hypothetical protein
MATFYTNVAANQQSGVNFPAGTSGIALAPTGFNDPVLELGSVDTVIATYTTVGTEAAADVINIVLLQAGQFVNPIDSAVVTNGLASTATVSIGDNDPAGASATRYSTALNLASATQLAFTGGAAALTPYSVSADCYLQATLATYATPGTGKLVTFWVQLASNR